MKTWKSIWVSRITVLALALSVVTACDEDTTSPDAVDPETTAQVMDQVVNDFFEGNEANQSLNVFGDAMMAAMGGAPAAAAMFDMLPDDGAVATVRRAQLAAPELVGSEGMNLPSGVLGNTFVWDLVTEQYVIDPEATGAPANGVRFILYAVDPILEEPVLVNNELVEIGHLDIIDTSDFPTINIAMVAVVGSDTLLDVSVIATSDQTTYTLDFSGYLSDGVEQLTFSIDAEATSETSASVTFTASHAGYTISLSITGSETLFSIVSRITAPDENYIEVTFSVDALGVIQSGSGVSFSGTQVAIISGNIEDPVITNGDGDPLTAEEIQALEELLDGMEEVFDFFTGLFEFALFLVLLGAI